VAVVEDVMISGGCQVSKVVSEFPLQGASLPQETGFG